MKIHILTNALDYGDAVSTHCILLKKRAREIGLEANLYAQFSDDRVREHVTSLDLLASSPAVDDLLLHQLFNDTALIPYVEAFPGRRLQMYHNITPPQYFAPGSPVHASCADGLRLARSLTGLYHHACAMSEFSRLDLETMGYARTSVFPLFLDLDRLLSLAPDPSLMNVGKSAETTFLFVGRVAPNKCIADLLQFLEAYRRDGARARLVIVGDDRQHPAYLQELLELARRLRLRLGEDVLFTGKIPDSQLVAWYRISDAFLSFSEHEGFGAPLIESMAFGLPTFAYAGGAVEETLGGAGLLFRSKEFERIAQDARNVLLNLERKASVVGLQHSRVRSFSADAQRDALRNLIRSTDQLAVPGRSNRRVSVVINTYNRSSHLETCLGTLRRQSYRDFEVVVVNGPSTDDTALMLRRFEGQIRLVETNSRVLSVSRNAGIQASTGELVAFIDDDAIADPRWLEELVKCFDDPNVGGAGGLVYRMNGRDIEFRNGIIDTEGFVLWNEPSPGTHWGWHDGYLNTVSGNNCIFRRSALEKIGGFDERIEYYHDEADVVMRLQLSGYRIVHWPDAVVYHEGARSDNRLGKYDLNWRAICKNTIYCALKNYAGPLPRTRMARRIARRVIRERMADVFHWWTSGHIATRDFLKMEYRSARGILEGVRRGLHPEPLHRSIGASPGDAEFHPYNNGNQPGFSVCVLSQGLPDKNPGGIATYTLNLANGLRQLGCTVHILSRGDSWSSELRHGIWFHTANSLPLDEEILSTADYPTTAKNLSYSKGVRSKLLDIESRWGLDVIESPNWDSEGLFSAIEHRTPTVVRAHSPMSKVAETQGWVRNADLDLCCSLEHLLIRHADVVSGSTEALLKLIDGEFGIGDRKALVPLGLDLAASPAAEPRSPRKRVLFVGRLERRKGIDTLLDAIPRVVSSADAVDFDVVGMDGKTDAGQTWKDFWNQRAGGLRDRVRFHGEVSQAELSRLYAACDVFVAPSLYESFGLIYLEAMAHAKPVIGCRAGGIPEVVLDGETGILVPPGDARSLADAVLTLLNDDALAQKFGAAGYRRYTESFTLQAMARRSLELYRRVARERALSGVVIWRGSAMDLTREPGSRIFWHPLTEQVCLLVDRGNARTPVFGPYIKLPEGSYRAEFKLWIEPGLVEDTRLGSVDVFSMKCGSLGERAFGTADFIAGPGSVVDVYFTVSGPPADDYEFRLHTSGKAIVYLREIVVCRWPPRALPHTA